ncbi:MAG: PCI domain-containing protein [Candidatus Jordarchaeaceae archaeon]
MKARSAATVLAGLLFLIGSCSNYLAVIEPLFACFLIFIIYPIEVIAGDLFFDMFSCSLLSSFPGLSAVLLFIFFYAGLVLIVLGLTSISKRGSVAGILAIPILLSGVPIPLIYQAINQSVSYSFLSSDMLPKTIFDVFLPLQLPNYYLYCILYIGFNFTMVYDIFGLQVALYYLVFLLMFYVPGLAPKFFYYNIASALVAACVSLIIGIAMWRRVRGKRLQLIGLLKSSEEVRFEEAAKRLGMSVKEVESTVLDLLAKDEIQGTITEKNIFVSTMGITKPKVSVEKTPIVEKGEAVKKPKIETMKCPFCGTSVEVGMKSCPKCGAVLV